MWLVAVVWVLMVLMRDDTYMHSDGCNVEWSGMVVGGDGMLVVVV